MYSHLGAGAADTARAGATYTATGASAAITAGAMPSTTDIGAATTAVVGAMQLVVGAGAAVAAGAVGAVLHCSCRRCHRSKKDARGEQSTRGIGAAHAAGAGAMCFTIGTGAAIAAGAGAKYTTTGLVQCTLRELVRHRSRRR